MAAMARSPHTPQEHLTQGEWCFLFLEHIDELATLAWYLVADSSLVECGVLRALARLDASPFEVSGPLTAYNQARDMLIEEALSVLDPAHAERGGATFAVQPYYPPDDLPTVVASQSRPAMRGERSRSLVPEILEYAARRIWERLPSFENTRCYDA